MNHFIMLFKWALPFLFFVLGLFGNLISFILFTRKKFYKLSALKVYACLTVINSVKIFFLIVQIYTEQVIKSNIQCAILSYFNSCTTCISSWFLAVISFDKYFTINFSRSSRLNCIQNVAIGLVIGLAMTYFLPYALLLIKLETVSLNNSHLVLCQLPNHFFLGELIISVVLPFFLMLTFSSMLIHRIVRTRITVRRFRRNQNYLKKDIKFGITTVFLNISYICLNLPFYVTLVLGGENIQVTHTANLLNIITFDLHVLSFCLSFLVFFISNSIFRQEFFKVFFCKNKRKSNSIKMTDLLEKT